MSNTNNSDLRHLGFDFLLPFLLYLVSDLLEGEGWHYLGVKAYLDDSVVLLVAETAVVVVVGSHRLLVPLLLRSIS